MQLHKIFPTLFLFAFLVNHCAAQIPKGKTTPPPPVQVVSLDSTTYVVQYIPLAEAQKRTEDQILQLEKQLQQIEKQLSDVVKKRDLIITQKAGLDAILKSLSAAPQGATQPPFPEQPPAETPAKKAKKKKN